MGNFDFGGDFDLDEKSLGTDIADIEPEYPDEEFDCLDDWDEEEYQ